ncbi:MAG: hypothetical protein GY856_35080 [bacterium]|nr:hypothetical protein [bacterium]
MQPLGPGPMLRRSEPPGQGRETDPEMIWSDGQPVTVLEEKPQEPGDVGKLHRPR